jgi:hypothetical protein
MENDPLKRRSEVTSGQAIFNLNVSVLPFLNARSEFNRVWRILCSPSFRTAIGDWKHGEPLHAGHVIWGGPPNMLLTWFVQRAIISLEAYIPPAAFFAGAYYRRLTPALIRAKSDPFSVGCRSAAQTFYIGIPGLIDTSLQMNHSCGWLWKDMKRFYEEVRNPLFHGSELQAQGDNHIATLDAVVLAFDFLLETYKWVDWWMPLKLVDMLGGIPVGELPHRENLNLNRSLFHPARPREPSGSETPPE